MKNIKWNKLFLHAVKIGIGSSVAIWIATVMGLEFATSAGSITLLTIVTTKWETLKLSFARLVTFVITVLLSWILLKNFPFGWVDFGILMFLLVVICDALGWKATLSVNALIGMHFLTLKDFSMHAILNEFLIVVIGISVALVVNMFHANESRKKHIMQCIQYTEKTMAEIVCEMADYLESEDRSKQMLIKINELDNMIREFMDEAYEYKNNVFQSHPEYYVNYFDMRQGQCNVLRDLYYKIRRIHKLPPQAKYVSEYIRDMSLHIREMNIPTNQIEHLKEMYKATQREELPKTHKEFEYRALLYHVMMDLEEFLYLKKRFVQEMDTVHYEKYWKKK